jgi:hypothetical protein
MQLFPPLEATPMPLFAELRQLAELLLVLGLLLVGLLLAELLKGMQLLLFWLLLQPVVPLLVLRLLLVWLLLGEDGPWLGTGVSFSQNTEIPSCAPTALTSAHWLGACCPV